MGESPPTNGASHSLGKSSLVLGVVALPLSIIPCLGFLSIPVSAMGLLLGLVGGVVALARKGSGIGYPIAGTTVSGLALMIGLFWVGALAAVSDQVARGAKKAPPVQVPIGEVKGDTPTGQAAGPNPAREPAPAADEWADATKATLDSDGVSVFIRKAEIGNVPLSSLRATQ